CVRRNNILRTDDGQFTSRAHHLKKGRLLQPGREWVRWWKMADGHPGVLNSQSHIDIHGSFN
ncbi:MAG: hypothetical protein KDC57_04540, partial [Saprospiraceae bacterium]|nr:hypothetical protein [Saprospiraceae bacterium]